MMLETLQKITLRLRLLLPLAVVLGCAGAAVFVWSVATADGDGYLAPGLLAAMWGAWLFTLVTGFRSVPPPAGDQQPFRTRFRSRMIRAGYTLMAWILLGAGLAALFLTWRLLVLWC